MKSNFKKICSIILCMSFLFLSVACQDTNKPTPDKQEKAEANKDAEKEKAADEAKAEDDAKVKDEAKSEEETQPADETEGESEAVDEAKTSNDKEAPKSTSEPLKLWHIHTAESRKIPIEESVKRFEEANGVKVEISVYENDPFKTKLKTVSGDDFPDVFHTWGGGWLKSFVDAGMVEDITDTVNGYIDKVNTGAIDMCTFDGKIYGSSIYPSSTLLFYNKELFDKYDLEVPETLEELDEVAKTFIDNGIIPFALGNKSKWPGAQHYVLLSMRVGGGDIWTRAMNGEIGFDDPAFIEAGDILSKQIDAGYFPEGMNGINYDTGGSRMMFYTGQCAMILQTSGFLASCRSENEDFYKTKLGVAAYPAIDGKPGKASDILAGQNSFSVSSHSKNKEMALKLVEHLSTDEQFQRDLLEGGSLSILTDLKPEDPLVAEVMNQLNEATYLQNFIDQTLTPELAEKHKDTVQGLFGKTLSPEEVAKEMQAQFESSK